jgi:CBS domain-containing protein
MAEIKAKDIMVKDVISVGIDTSIEELSQILLKNRISGVPVIDEEGKLLGVVSEADIIVKDSDLHFPRIFKLLGGIIYLESLNKFKKNLVKHLATKVEDIMTKKVKTADPDMPVNKIADMMLEGNINRIPVIDEKRKVIGIITRADIVRSISKDFS